jgi:hypothetical protein
MFIQIPLALGDNANNTKSATHIVWTDDIKTFVLSKIERTIV